MLNMPHDSLYPIRWDGASTVYQDVPCTLNWGFIVPNNGYLGPYGGQEEGPGTGFGFRILGSRDFEIMQDSVHQQQWLLYDPRLGSYCWRRKPRTTPRLAVVEGLGCRVSVV